MKLLKVLLPLALCFVLLAGCGKKVELAGWEDYKDHPAQDVYAGEVAAPERIVMTRDGREKNSFDKGTETYEKIVSTLGQLIEAQLDENEQVKDLGRKLDGLKTMPELDKGVWLIYEGTLGVFGDRLGKLLFKLVVEHNMTNHLLGGDIDMTRDEYNKMRGNSVREVAGTHGNISFRDVLLFHQEE